ncbi:hypothetical protein FH972_016491 [Carpinus fangiana]|uniref:Peptidase A1 domain-containing protein n=1 Tax=Carpinus fangiana TaxID=176857 RepID=A0A5N6RI54_9ROSI|nr:hypothetical protein FH972_016491 [Carpinus fangiana]
MRGLVPLLAAFAAMLVSVVYCVLPPTLLPLERAFPLTRRVELDRLRARDRARHARFLRGAVSGVVDFSVQGSSDPYFVGLILEVTSCGLPVIPAVQLNFFDAASSSTTKLVPCSDPMCTSALQTAATQCSPQSNQCSYSFQYGDGSGTSCYYVSDALYFDMVLGQSLIANSSAPIVFGCSTCQFGDLTKTDKAVDGIFGFGQGDLSVISQLSSRAITPKVFSHCLKGGGNGGGILVLGEILEPGIVYSPLVPSQPHYNLYLQSIAVNGQLLPIDPAAFATSNNRGTIVDSGTTLAYLVDEAYDPFVSSITAIVQQSVIPTISNGNQCYLVSTSVNEIFSPVSLNFAGSASMVLKPEEYLVHIGFSGGAAMWCIGFQRVQEGVTILGG